MSGTLRLRGATSGYSELQAPAVAADQTFVLPTAGGTLLTTDSPVPKLTLELGSASQPSLTFEGDTDTGLYSSGTNTLNLVTGGSNRLNIDSLGRVSIGTSSALTGSTLTVAGNALAVTGQNTAHSANSIRIGEEGSGAAQIRCYGPDASTNGSLTLRVSRSDGSNSQDVKIDSSGNVGIGTTSPSRKLTVNSSTTDTVALFESSDADCQINFQDSTSSADGISLGCKGDNFYVRSGLSTERMRIDNSGRIGFGVSTMAGGAGSPTIIRNSALRWADSDGTQRADIYGDSSSNLVFRNGTGSTERMRIDSNGKLVVGSSSFISGANGFTQAMISGGDGGLIINSTNTSATSYCRLMFTPNGHITGNEGMIRYNTNDYHMAFWTQGNERMRIDSSGTLVIGRTASSDPNRYVQIHNGSAASSAYLQSTNTGTGSGAADGIVMGMGDATNAYFWNYENGAIIFATNGTQRALFDSSGNLLVGKSGSNFAVQGVEIRGGGEITLTRQGDLLTTRRITTEGTHMSIRSVGGTVIGTISTNGTNASFNDLSDYRFKENIIALSNGIERIKLLKPSQYNFISNSSSTIDGFLAHEVQAVVPEAVTGEKDAIDENGEAVSQMLDRSKLIPLLTAALQEAIDKIETLEAKVAALET